MATLRLLLIEDSERDAALLQLFLRRARVDAQLTRIETEQQLHEELGRGPWDAVVSDFNLPQFSADDALRIVRAAGVTAPFFVSSGARDDASAARLGAAGSSGFFEKSEMAKLVAAISEVSSG